MRCQCAAGGGKLQSLQLLAMWQLHHHPCPPRLLRRWPCIQQCPAPHARRSGRRRHAAPAPPTLWPGRGCGCSSRCRWRAGGQPTGHRGQAGKQAGVKAMHADANLEGKAITCVACGQHAAAGKRADALSWNVPRFKQQNPGSTARLSPGTAAHPPPPPHRKQPGRPRSSHRWGPASAQIKVVGSDSVRGAGGAATARQPCW